MIVTVIANGLAVDSFSIPIRTLPAFEDAVDDAADDAEDVGYRVYFDETTGILSLANRKGRSSSDERLIDYYGYVLYPQYFERFVLMGK